MVKSHNCLVKIANDTKSDVTYVGDWHDSGRLADGFSWPQIIRPDQKPNVLNYERDNSWAGCSGYVTYNMFGTEVTIAFSNPVSGTNKLGVGTGGKQVWDDMENHDYSPFSVRVTTTGGQTLLFHCQCTGGTTNTCSVQVNVLA